ncbi:DDE-type integrase/transposase/recombinase [Colwellia psychrerythraea]|uniref:Integrase catalytic region n=1 Tax=Colwellia psychrerythraea TaxID=28229 RepID=A0A099K8J0_COLPS|nr:DDE-type integrase/transposase/recombinase [Colwellia psychrerythraea]KGJ86412.1 Integrase catalytic region [Colwellia psychrerythraea]
MTKEWFNLSEITSFSGTHSTVQGNRKLANREAWQKRKCQIGKGYEYHIDSLPQETQAYLAAQAESAAVVEASQASPEFLAGKAIAQKRVEAKALDAKQLDRIKQQGAAELMQLTGKARLRADVKLCILAAYDTYLIPFIRQNQKVAGERLFAEQFNEHALGFDHSTYEVVAYIRWNYPRRWQKLLNEEGAAALGGRYKADKKSKIDREPKMQQMAQGLIYNEPEINGSHLREILIAHSELNNLNWDVPSVSKMREWLKRFKAEHPLLIAKLNNPDDFKNRYMPAFGKANANVIRINQLWELDSTPTDVHLTDGRYSIIGAIDIYSRRPIVILQPTSNSEAVCLLMRKAMLAFGVPESVKIDNGKDYKSKRVTSVFQSLGIKTLIAPPFSGDAKPSIERFFGTWSHGIAKLLPGYGGHDVASREKLQSRASFADQIMKKGAKDIEISLSAKELQIIIDDWIEHYYNHNIHGTTKEKPIVRWNSQRTTLRTIENERALDVLLSPIPASGSSPAGKRTVAKDVGIAVNGFSYVSADLGALVGSDVFCSWNPDNIGEIYVFNSAKLEFICKVKCPELVDEKISLAELGLAAKRQQNAKITEQKAALRKAKNSVNLGDAARNVIAAAKKRNSSMAFMPQPSEPAQSGLLHQASFASDLTPVKPTLSPENFQALRQEQIELEKAKEIAVNAKPRFKNDYEQFIWILNQAKQRKLTGEEIVIREEYKKAQPKWAKQAAFMVGENEEKQQEQK